MRELPVEQLPEQASRSYTSYEALMQAVPGNTPEDAIEDGLALRDLILDVFEAVLDDREQWILNALLFRRLSLRACGNELSLSKTHVARLRDRALTTLRTALKDKEAIKNHLLGKRDDDRD